ncbi:MAG TPA: 2Fe-2S iron-sulfur cluster-binding protein [Planctomycetota bacterium]|nr:2Fe-2S iron-sulfur cluster-binding protein [Planctomycetota bacterium]
MPTVRFFREGITCEAQAGDNLREVAIRAGVQLYRRWHVLANCRGRGKCGSCRIELSVAGAVEPPARTAAECHHLDRRFSDATTRLACQVRVQHDLSVLTQEQRTAPEVETRSFLPRGF